MPSMIQWKFFFHIRFDEDVRYFFVGPFIFFMKTIFRIFELMILICQNFLLHFHLQCYTKSFTLALQTECKPYGIKVQLLSPYFVSTKLNSYSKEIMSGNILIPNVQTYGRSAVFTLGKSYETTGYWSHAVQVCLQWKTFFLNEFKL